VATFEDCRDLLDKAKTTGGKPDLLVLNEAFPLKSSLRMRACSSWFN